MDRERRGFERDRFSGPEHYRRGRSPPPREHFRQNRSPPPAPHRAPPPNDAYVPAAPRAARPRSRSPGGYRRRSRSPRPGYRGQGDVNMAWREKPRSPPRAGYAPPRAEEYREGRPEGRYRARSPAALKRGRELSPPGGRDVRAPPPAKRERIEEPPRGRYEDPRGRPLSPPHRAYSPPRDRAGFRPRSRSPHRPTERVEPYAAEPYRRRSPSPPRAPRHEYPSGENSGRESPATSRRSSPPVHPSRMAHVAPPSGYPQERSMRPPPTEHRPPYQGRSSERSPPRRHEEPAPREREYPASAGRPAPAAPYRNGDGGYARPPPSGPGGSRNFSSPATAPPSGPASASVSMSAHSRNSNASILSAPSRPRGGGGSGRGYGREPSMEYQRDYPRDFSGPPPRRGPGPFPSSPHQGRGGPPPGGFSGPSHGPRGPSSGPSHYPPPFRGSNNSTSTTYPRTQRFRDHMADAPKIVAGGQRQPEPFDTTKITKLEEDARKLREIIAEKQAKKRQGLRDWDKLERENGNVALRSELAEQQLRDLNGEGDVGGAAF